MSYSVEEFAELIRYHVALGHDDPSEADEALERLVYAVEAMRSDAPRSSGGAQRLPFPAGNPEPPEAAEGRQPQALPGAVRSQAVKASH